jgi:23S rRNA (guanosine2251-2'-O)-methyltransferase
MTLSYSEIYQCDNPECLLRFPVYAGGTKPRRCPVCRSSMHVELIQHAGKETERIHVDALNWKLELLLDNIRSAWNVGSILRTADGMGVKKAYCCGITPSPNQASVSKTALGAQLSIEWESYKNGLRQANSLKSNGCTLWALEDVRDATPLYSITADPTLSPVVLILGNENCGVDPAILELCDMKISIPMFGDKQSYNVAVAFGMAVSFLFYRHKISQESLRILPSS